MLKQLVKKQLAEIFRAYFYNPKTNQPRAKGTTIAMLCLFALLMGVFLCGMFALLSLMLCEPFADAGLGWLYFALLALLGIAFGTFGSVFNTYAGLYLAKDNDLLLSMPIPVRDIMIARLSGVYLMGLMYSATVTLPAAIIYFCTVRFTVPIFIGAMLLVFLVSVIVLFLSCLLGWVIAKISLKLKRKSLITVLASLAFFALYYFIYFKAQSVLSALLENLSDWGSQAAHIYPLYLFGRVGEGDPLAMAVVTGVVGVLFALLWCLMSRSFLRIATAGGNGAKVVYRERDRARHSADRALLGKELSRFLGSSTYMLNCGMGLLFLLAVAIVLIVKGNALQTMLTADATLSDLRPLLPTLFCGVIGLILGMVDITAPSISLEGKSLWLAQSLPISPKQCLRAKLLLQILLTAPFLLLCSIVGIVTLRPEIFGAILMLIVPQTVSVFQAAFGLTLNLLRPSLNWSNEIYPIKQSMSVFLTLFGGWLVGALPFVSLFFTAILPADLCLTIYWLLLVAACAFLLLHLRGRGSATFANLSNG